jgi:hypothetical protein
MDAPSVAGILRARRREARDRQRSSRGHGEGLEARSHHVSRIVDPERVLETEGAGAEATKARKMARGAERGG